MNLKLSVLCVSDLLGDNGLPVLVSGGTYDVVDVSQDYPNWVVIEGEESRSIWTHLSNRHFIVYGKGVKRIGVQQ